MILIILYVFNQPYSVITSNINAPLQFNMEGKEHNLQLREYAAVIAKKHLSSHETSFHVQNNKACNILQQHIEHQPDSAINMTTFIQNFASDSSSILVVGHDLQALRKPFRKNDQAKLWSVAIRSSIMIAELRRMPLIAKGIELLLQSQLIDGAVFFALNNIAPAIKERLASGATGNDLGTRFPFLLSVHLSCTSLMCEIVSTMIPENRESIQDIRNLQKQAQILYLAASESSSLTLCGMIYHAARYPIAHEKLVKEIRNAFSSHADININAIESLPYLGACLNESMRLYPPGTGTATRRTPKEGATVCGRFVAGDMVVGVNFWSSNRSTRNFAESNDFKPERWLDPPSIEFSTDVLGAFQPFLYGPKQCVGKE